MHFTLGPWQRNNERWSKLQLQMMQLFFFFYIRALDMFFVLSLSLSLFFLSLGRSLVCWLPGEICCLGWCAGVVFAFKFESRWTWDREKSIDAAFLLKKFLFYELWRLFCVHNKMKVLKWNRYSHTQFKMCHENDSQCVKYNW